MKLFTSLAVLAVVPLMFIGAAKEKDAATCPISKKPAKAEFSLNVNGKVVSFCCNNCPKAYAKKINLKGGAAQLAAGPAACPISGKAGTKENQVIKKTAKLTSFCCGNCLKKAVTSEGLAFADKGPKKCPVSGKPATAENSLLVNGESIYFCCGNCPKGYAKKIGINAKALEKDPGNCPLTGKPAKKDKTLILVKSELVSFCCGNCKAKYVTANFKNGKVIGKNAKKKAEKKKVRL